MLVKVCFKCGVEKPLTEYYKHQRMKDGHLNKCKNCIISDVKQHRRENESVREYDRKRGCRQSREYQKQHRLDNPEKYKARTLIGNMLRDGKIFRPNFCSECQKKCKPHGHHDDYSKPTVVRWLCARCHALFHAENGKY